jgi:hypothetical protein
MRTLKLQVQTSIGGFMADPNGEMDKADHYRKVNVVDPEGNTISFCEVNDV